MLKCNDLNTPATIAKQLLWQQLTLARTSLANVRFIPKEGGKFWRPLGVRVTTASTSTTWYQQSDSVYGYERPCVLPGEYLDPIRKRTDPSGGLGTHLR